VRCSCFEATGVWLRGQWVCTEALHGTDCTHAETPSAIVDTFAVSKTIMYCPSTGSPAALSANTAQGGRNQTVSFGAALNCKETWGHKKLPYTHTAEV
jgi:hypothetical protein